MNIYRSLILTGGLIALMTFAGAAQSTSSDGAKTASRGTVACVGSFRDTGLSVDMTSRWSIHNLNNDASITLDRMRVYAADGSDFYDSDRDGNAPSATVVPFGVIKPFQVVSFFSRDFLDGSILTRNLLPVTVIFDWSSTKGRRVLTPYVNLLRRGPSNSDTRFARDCRTID